MKVTIQDVQGYNVSIGSRLMRILWYDILMVGIYGKGRDHITRKEAGVRLASLNPIWGHEYS